MQKSIYNILVINYSCSNLRLILLRIYSESIFGYKGLRAKLYYSACRLTMYFGQEYEAVVDPKSSGGVEVKTKFINSYFWIQFGK